MSLFTGINTRLQADISGWAQEKQAGAVTIFSRIPEGARVKEFRALTNIAAPMDAVWRVLRDVSRYPGWFGDCMAAEEVSKFSEDRIQYFLLMKTAGPLKNREIYADVYYSGSKSSEKREILMKDAPEIPRKSYKTSRPIKTLSGLCVLTAPAPGTTKVEYSILIDPGEEIPAALSNMYILGQVEKIMAGLIKTSGDKAAK